MEKKLLALYGLKFNPFTPSLPTTALYRNHAVEQFCWRIEHQLAEGGFALILGDPGQGKSVALRVLTERLSQKPDRLVAALSRPQASLADFYRELGHLFGVALILHSRWNNARSLRDKWLHHIDNSLHRPVLLVDEAQQMSDTVFCELRLLASADLDSRSILTIVLCGDQRLGHRLEEPELLPIASRMRSRLRLEALPPKQLQDALNHRLKAAGNVKLLSPGLLQTLCDHAAGNLRLLLNMADDLLIVACQQERDLLDEKLYFEVFALDPKPAPKRPLA